ncbi:MAG: hypothetical protein OXQ29_27800, partial [Rhodospirillaceae bacterium]|nr:hypothetical protein [Rhodospirillaceae bacterium]
MLKQLTRWIPPIRPTWGVELASALKPWGAAPLMETGGPTIEDVIDSLNAGGYPPLAVGDKLFTRELAASYATVFRVTTLISGVVAELLANGARVQDRDGRRVRSGQAMRALDLIRESPDGILSAHAWLEDFTTDYLLDGNAISFTEGPIRAPTRLRLMESWGARAYSTRNGGPVYEA